MWRFGRYHHHHHHHPHPHHIYFRQQQTMSIITNNCTVGGLPEKLISHWLAAQIKWLWMFHRILQYQVTKKQQQGQEAKTTKLCASAIGIRGAFKKFCNSTIKKNGNVTNYTLFFNIIPTEFNASATFFWQTVNSTKIEIFCLSLQTASLSISSSS